MITQAGFDGDIAAPLGLELTGGYPEEVFTRWGFLGEEHEPARDLSIYGASAGLDGGVDDLIKIAAALMRGDLLGKEAMAQMWDGDPALGFMALGQWVFAVALEGFAEPVRIVERRGDIGAVRVQNFILPEKELAVVAFSQAKPFEFGEVWMGSSFSYDLLSAAACPSAPDK